MEQEKRGLCPYDDNRYLLADLPNGHPNPNTHAYGHRDLAAEEHLVADQPEPGVEMVIRHREERFVRKHARVTKRLEFTSVMDKEEKLPDGDADVELNGDQLLVIAKVAATQPGCTIQMCDVIERINANNNLERLISSPAMMAKSPTPKYAGPCGLNAHATPFRGRIDSFKEKQEAPERLVWPPTKRIRLHASDMKESDGDTEPSIRRKGQRRHRPCIFIDAEAAVDGDASGDEAADDNDDDDLNGFIVSDDVEFKFFNLVSSHFLFYY